MVSGKGNQKTFGLTLALPLVRICLKDNYHCISIKNKKENLK